MTLRLRPRTLLEMLSKFRIKEEAAAEAAEAAEEEEEEEEEPLFCKMEGVEEKVCFRDANKIEKKFPIKFFFNDKLEKNF